MPPRVFSERHSQAALIVCAAVIVQGLAGASFAAVYGFDVASHADLDVLLARGPGISQAFRSALLIDMLGYLAVAPVVLHLWGRASAPSPSALSWRIDVVSFFGLLFSLVGPIV